jgi:hypothetical protein
MYNICQFTINVFQNHFSKHTWIKHKLFLLGWIPLWGGRSSRVHTTVLILGFLFWRLQDLQKIQMAPLYWHIIKALSTKFIYCKTQYFSKKSCEKSITITVHHVLQAVKMKQQDWWIIKCGNSQSNSVIFKRAITDYVNLQMMGLLFKL